MRKETIWGPGFDFSKVFRVLAGKGERLAEKIPRCWMICQLLQSLAKNLSNRMDGTQSVHRTIELNYHFRCSLECILSKNTRVRSRYDFPLLHENFLS